MDAVAAADADRVLVLDGAALQGGEQAVEIADQEIGGADQLDIEAGIEHIGRGHALMHEARLGADDLGEMGQEGDDIVLHLALDRVDAGDIEDRVAALVPDFLGRLLRHDAKLGHGVGGVGLDLEPDAEAGLRLPKGGHFLAGVAGDHVQPLAIAGKAYSISKGNAKNRRLAPSKPWL